MQIRCSNCHKPFGLNKETVHAALDSIVSEEFAHFNVACPHCRRVNKVSQQELLRAAPDWVRRKEEGEHDLHT